MSISDTSSDFSLSHQYSHFSNTLLSLLSNLLMFFLEQSAVHTHDDAHDVHDALSSVLTMLSLRCRRNLKSLEPKKIGLHIFLSLALCTLIVDFFSFI